jgi:glycerol-3-phosphate O-acyltransferase
VPWPCWLAERHALTRDELQAQLNTYLDLLKQVPYSPHSTMPDEDARTLLEQAMELNKFEVSEDKLGQIISLDRYQAILLTYYRNNILHLFAMPSLVAALIERCRGSPAARSSPAVSTSTPCSRPNSSCAMKRRSCLN